MQRKRGSERARESDRTKRLLLLFLTKRQCLIKPVTGHKSNNCLCGGCWCHCYYCCHRRRRCCQCNSFNDVSSLAPKLFSHTPSIPCRSMRLMVSFFPHTHEHLFLSLSAASFFWVFVGCFHFITCCCSRSEYHSSFLSIHLQFSQSRVCYQTYMTVVGSLPRSGLMCKCVCSPVLSTHFQYLSYTYTQQQRRRQQQQNQQLSILLLCNLCTSRCLSYQIMSLKSNFKHSLQHFLSLYFSHAVFIRPILFL